MKTVAEQSTISPAPLGSVMELLGNLNRNFELAPYCREVCSPILEKRSKSAACKRFLNYERKLTRAHFLSLGSQWVTKVGFTVMTQKQNNCRCRRAHKSPRAKNGGRSGVQQRACSLFFFRCEGDCCSWFVPPNTTVNYEFYCDVLKRLRENLRRQELWRNSFTTITRPPTCPWKPQSLYDYHSKIDIQWESQAVFDSIKENNLHSTFVTWKKKQRRGPTYTRPPLPNCLERLRKTIKPPIHTSFQDNFRTPDLLNAKQKRYPLEGDMWKPVSG
jgi:hypothetical protein